LVTLGTETVGGQYLSLGGYADFLTLFKAYAAGLANTLRIRPSPAFYELNHAKDATTLDSGSSLWVERGGHCRIRTISQTVCWSWRDVQIAKVLALIVNPVDGSGWLRQYELEEESSRECVIHSGRVLISLASENNRVLGSLHAGIQMHPVLDPIEVVNFMNMHEDDRKYRAA
jgi:hypothetical protein